MEKVVYPGITDVLVATREDEAEQLREEMSRIDRRGRGKSLQEEIRRVDQDLQNQARSQRR